MQRSQSKWLCCELLVIDTKVVQNCGSSFFDGGAEVHGTKMIRVNLGRDIVASRRHERT